jgi:CRP-like cAMP-binding protein
MRRIRLLLSLDLRTRRGCGIACRIARVDRGFTYVRDEYGRTVAEQPMRPYSPEAGYVEWFACDNPCKRLGRSMITRTEYKPGYVLAVAKPLLFAGIDEGEVERILATARRRTFRRGDIVFHEGDPGDSMQLVVRGHFALRLVTRQGDVCTFRIFAPGEAFGRIAVGPLEAVRDMTVVCLDTGETAELFRTQLDKLRAAHPSVNDALIANAGVELRRIAGLLFEALYVDADQRVRRRLVEVGQLFRDADTGVPVIPLNQGEIASLAGTSRATVSRVLAEEERRGTLAKRRRRIVLIDEEELGRLARRPDKSPPREASRA